MPSVVEGFTYDIFISYRLKDNKVPDKDSNGWVSKFVSRLEKEIQTTIKEDISIYFDENPYDGILATHDVGDSLKDKLKCLIFIPILSQTYCDPNSFAWKNEFLVFKNLCSEDQFGLKVKLQNGNVSSRILPVCIHDLDAADREIVENEIGPIRSVDFIFRSPGVNRPLTPADRREDNPSRIVYRDQINKLANAIKDIIRAVKNPAPELIHQPPKNTSRTNDRGKQMKVGVALFAAIVAVMAAFYFTTKNRTPPVIDKSIAVLPFVDMTADHAFEFLGDGIAEEIINSLTSIRDLRIIGRTSSFQFKGEKLDLRDIGKRLDVATILEGSIQQSGNKLRITAQLIRTSDNSHIWSKQFNVEETDFFKIQDNIAANVVETLSLTLSSFEEARLVKKGTSEEAYLLYLKGLFQYKRENYQPAADIFQQVVAIDSLYAPAIAYLALSRAWLVIRMRDLTNIPRIEDAIRLTEKATALDPTLPEAYSARALIAWAIQQDYVKARTYFEKSLEMDPGSSLIKNRYCYFLTWMGEFDKATKLANEAMRLDPADYNSYFILYVVSLYSNRLQEARHYHKELRNVTGSNHFAASRDIELSFYEEEFKKVNHLCDSLLNAGDELATSDLSYNSMAYFGQKNLKLSDQFLRALTRMEKTSKDNPSYFAARTFAFRNQVDSCLVHLSKALDNKEPRLNHLKIDPAFRDLHSDPRYIQIYNARGFDRY
ncbi:MAG TPA: tetratricopeptide repeat protein [Chryseolinea sp.]